MKPHLLIPLLVVCVGVPLVALGMYYLCESLPATEAARAREKDGMAPIIAKAALAAARAEREEEEKKAAEEREAREREERDARERKTREESEERQGWERGERGLEIPIAVTVQPVGGGTLGSSWNFGCEYKLYADDLPVTEKNTADMTATFNVKVKKGSIIRVDVLAQMHTGAKKSQTLSFDVKHHPEKYRAVKAGQKIVIEYYSSN